MSLLSYKLKNDYKEKVKEINFIKYRQVDRRMIVWAQRTINQQDLGCVITGLYRLLNQKLKLLRKLRTMKNKT